MKKMSDSPSSAVQVVAIDSVEHAQSVLKQMRSRASSSRNYQTIDGSSHSGLKDFNSLVTEKAAEVAQQADARQKEASLLSLISSPLRGNAYSSTVSHTLKSDRYELSPSKAQALANGDFATESGYYAGNGNNGSNNKGSSLSPHGKGPVGGLPRKMERMALNRPRSKDQSGQSQGGAPSSSHYNCNYDEKSRGLLSDDDLLASDDDDLPYGTGAGADACSAADSPPKGGAPWDEPVYDSDDEKTLTAAELGMRAGGKHASKTRKLGIGATSAGKGGAGQLRQGTTSQKTDGVSHSMLSPHSSPDGPTGPGRVRVQNPVQSEAQLRGADKESQDFAAGLQYMMEASLNEKGEKGAHGSPTRSVGGRESGGDGGHGSCSSTSSMGHGSGMAKSVGSLPSRTTTTTTTTTSSGGPSMSASTSGTGMNIRGSSKSILAEDLGRTKGAVLKKGGLFVRAGGRKARQEAKGV